jgi:hypothetical protein
VVVTSQTKTIDHQNSNDAEIAPNVNWPKSQSFVHVDEQGNLSPALTKQFLPARAALLADYWQKTVDKTTATTHCLSTIHDHLCIVT